MKQNLLPLSFQQNKPLSSLSTFGIGGPAKLFAEAHSVEQMQELLLYCHHHHISTFILGKGSNCLFDDRGFDGAVILNKIQFCRFDWPVVEVGGGYSFSLLGTQTARQGWSGLEFASGIPGSVGGAVFMNAGANGSDVSKTLTRVDFVTQEGKVETFSRGGRWSLVIGRAYFKREKERLFPRNFPLRPQRRQDASNWR